MIYISFFDRLMINLCNLYERFYELLGNFTIFIKLYYIFIKLRYKVYIDKRVKLKIKIVQLLITHLKLVRNYLD